MSQLYERSARRRQTALLEYLDPKMVLRHRGGHEDFHARYRAAARLAIGIGRAGVRVLAPYLDRYCMDTRMLKVAWDHLSVYGGTTPGPDGETYESVPDDEVWSYLKSLHHDLSSSKYSVHEDEEFVRAISKGAGRGKRYLTLQCVFHRIVQRAALEVLQSLLDPRFDDRSFGYRPRLGTTHALATANALFCEKRRPYLIVADIKDAFGSVPLPRLLQILESYIPSPKLAELVKTMLSGARRPGLRQGGSLSPILLNLYLHHVLDRPWRRKFPKVPLLRYADDLLLMCRSRCEAEQAFQFLQQTLQSAGMSLKRDFADSLTDLGAGEHCAWLGFSIRSQKRKLQFSLGDGAFEGFKESVTRLIAEHDSPEDKIAESLRAWLSQYGPAYPRCGVDHACNRLRKIAALSSIGVFPENDEIRAWWRAAKKNWIRVRDAALELAA